MPETYNINGIVLSKKKVREKDSLISIYTEEKGKIELVARGTQKLSSKLSGSLEPISLVNIMVVRGKKNDYVGSAHQENGYKKIKDNFDSAYLSSKAIATTDELVKSDEKDKKIFYLLLSYLEILNKKNIEHDIFYSFYILKLIDILGHRPNIAKCSKCDLKINNNFIYDFSKHESLGIECFSEKANIDYYSLHLIKLFDLVFNNKMDDLTKIKISIKLKRELIKFTDLLYKTIKHL